MTIAFKIGDEDSQVKGFIYLDAVTVYTKTLSGKVTSFPVDSGVNISDHYISNNNKFTVEGVVTNVDITGMSDKVQVDEKAINAKPQPTPVVIEEGTDALRFLPSAVRQFFEKREVTVYSDEGVQDTTIAVEALLIQLLSANYYNEVDKKWRNKMTFTTLYEMEGLNFVNAKTDLVITDVSFLENVDTGDSLQMSFTLEKVRIVTLDKTEMPKNTSGNTKKKVSSTSEKGKQNTESGDSSNPQTSSPKKVDGPANSFRAAKEKAQAR